MQQESEAVFPQWKVFEFRWLKQKPCFRQVVKGFAQSKRTTLKKSLKRLTKRLLRFLVQADTERAEQLTACVEEKSGGVDENTLCSLNSCD